MDSSTSESGTASDLLGRRAFLQRSCGWCIAALAAGVTASSLSGCAPLPLYRGKQEKGTITVPMTELGEKKLLLVRTPQSEFDLLLVRDAKDKFHTLLMRCSHQEQPLTATADGLYCASHGSQFDLAGNVQKAPATAPLQKFVTTVENGQFVIHL